MIRTIVLVLAVLLGIVGLSSVFIVTETEYAIKFQLGRVVRADYEPGLHFKLPFVNNVRKFDGRVLTVDSQPERFFTQEQKALIVDSYAKFKIKDTAKFYTATNGEMSRAMALLSQRINNGLRNQVAVRTIQEVVSGERDQLMEDLQEELDEVAIKAQSTNITLEAFGLTWMPYRKDAGGRLTPDWQ